jgi:hypothetical protein
MDTAELTNGSDLVVLAAVRGILPRLEGQDPSGFSYVLLDVTEVWKGPKTTSVTVKLLGGQTSLDDPKSARIPGVPLFLPGDSSLFFLSRRPEEGGLYYNVRGWSQGRLRLADPSTFEDGRKVGEVRTEVEHHVRDPRPPRYPSRSQVRPAAARPVGPPLVRELPPSRGDVRTHKKPRPTVKPTPPGGDRPGLSEGERSKLEEMKGEIRNRKGRR